MLAPLTAVLRDGNEASRWLARQRQGESIRAIISSEARAMETRDIAQLASVATDRTPLWDDHGSLLRLADTHEGVSRYGPSALAIAAQPGATGVIRVLGERLELVEDLWLTILRSECGPQQLERLLRLKELVGPCIRRRRQLGTARLPAVKVNKSWR